MTDDGADSRSPEPRTDVIERRTSPPAGLVAPSAASGDGRVGPYRLGALLGRGGQGAVHVAEHVETGRRVALKTIAAASSDVLASMRREIRALSLVGDGRHPGIVRVLDRGDEAGAPWYAMELVEGQTLRAFVIARIAAASGGAPARGLRGAIARTAPEGGLPRAAGGLLRDVLQVVGRVCRALAFLHGEGLTHRDLKPENVLVTAGDAPVLVDFGLARSTGGKVWRERLDESAGEVAGTVAYMAPECWRGAIVDARADLYALGCILHEVVAGVPPFPAESVAEIMSRHLGETPRPLSASVDGVPAELDALVLALLRKEPGDRLGFADDVIAWLERAGLASIPMEGPEPRPHVHRPPLAGRDALLAARQSDLDALVEGRGSIVFLGGASGVGKTRLAMEVAERAAAMGVVVLAGECREAPTQARVPLQAFQGPLAQIAALCRDAGPERIAQVLGPRAPLLAPYAPSLGGFGGPSVAGMSKEGTRLRVVVALATVLRELSRIRPVLLLLDDLQWADELTLDVVDHLSGRRRFAESRLVLLATYRAGETDERLRSMVSAPGATSVRVGALSAEASRAVVAGMLALADPPDELVAALSRDTEGNPLFLAEHVRAAVSRGLLRRGERGSWSLAVRPGQELAPLPLPTSLRELLAERLVPLLPGDRRVLEIGALLGGSWEQELLAAACGGDVTGALGELLARELVVEPAPARYRFSHDALRQVVETSIPEERGRELHAVIAGALEAAGDESPGRAAERARHWELAEERVRARDVWLAAAREATAVRALPLAESCYRSHLRLVSRPSEASIRSLTALAGEVLFPAGQTEEAVRIVEEALTEAWELGDTRLAAEAQLVLGRVLRHRGHPARARIVAEEAAARFEDAGDRHGIAAARRLLAVLHVDAGEVHLGITILEGLLPELRALGERVAEAEVTGIVATLLADTGETERGLELHRRAIAIHRECRDRVGEGVALANLGLLHRSRGMVDEARACWEAALAINREVGDVQTEATTLANLGVAFWDQGNAAESERLIRAARDLFHATGRRGLEAAALTQLAVLAVERDPREARGMLEAALALAVAAGERQWELQALLDLGRLPGVAGAAGAASALARARALAHASADLRQEGNALVAFARQVRISGGLAARSIDLLDEAERLLRAGGYLPDLVECLCERGFVEAAAGRDAAPCLDRAREAVAGMSYPSWPELRSVRRLERAVARAAAGAPLVSGMAPEDAPAGIATAGAGA